MQELLNIAIKHKNVIAYKIIVQCTMEEDLYIMTVYNVKNNNDILTFKARDSYMGILNAVCDVCDVIYKINNIV